MTEEQIKELLSVLKDIREGVRTTVVVLSLVGGGIMLCVIIAAMVGK